MSYSPKIKPELVRKLYQYKHSKKEKPPMTKLVNEAVEDYLERLRIQNEQRKDTEAAVDCLRSNL